MLLQNVDVKESSFFIAFTRIALIYETSCLIIGKAVRRCLTNKTPRLGDNNERAKG